MVAIGCQQADSALIAGVVGRAGVDVAPPAGAIDVETAVAMLPAPPAPVALPERVWTTSALALEIVPAPPAPEPVAPPVTTRPAVVAPAPTTRPAPVAPPPASAPAAPVAAAPAPASVTNNPAAAADVAGRTNAVRSGQGLAPLARDGGLDSMAANWAAHMATAGTLQHSTLTQQLVGNPWSTAGENIGYGPSSAVVHDALVNSPGHYANIVGPAYTRIGVGAATDATGRLWVVEVFVG